MALKAAGEKISLVEDPRGHIIRSQQDVWLSLHARSECVDFSLKERTKLQKYYLAMSLGRKSVNLPQVEDFMIGRAPNYMSI